MFFRIVDNREDKIMGYTSCLLVVAVFAQFYKNGDTKELHTVVSRKSALMEGCTISRAGGFIDADCSFMELTFVPSLPKFCTSVNLSNNLIRSIYFPPFLGMNSLLKIDLSNNPLQYIPSNMFTGLTKLTNLKIKNSLLYKQPDLVLDSLLAGLENLKQFSFTFQVPDNPRFSPRPCSFSYQRQPFGNVDSLKTVETLEIDSALLKWKTNTTSSKYDAFNTKSLYLVNGFVCFYGQMTEDQFRYMPLLEIIEIENPFLTCAVTSDFLEAVKHLKELSIYGPNTPYRNVLDLILNVTQSISDKFNLTSLRLEDVSDSLRYNLHCHLGIYDMTKLNDLREFSLAGNSLSLNTLEECDQFPKSLEYVNLERNCISSSDIMNDVIFFNEHIKVIEASDQSHCAFKSYLRSSFQAYRYKRYPEYFELERLVFTNSTEQLDFGCKSDHYNQLKYLDLSLNDKVMSTTIPDFFSSSRPNLEYLKLSDCRIKELQEYSFSNFSKLEYLDLSSNNLGHMGCHLNARVSKLPRLKELNISHNAIQCVRTHMFAQMGHLEMVNLSNNEIHDFDASLLHTKNLVYLDLSVNRLQKLSYSTTKDLDRLASLKQIRVDLSGNTLLCTCETLDFLKWLKFTKVILVQRDNYVCTFNNGSSNNFSSLSYIISSLNSQCTSYVGVVIGVSVTISVCLVSLGSIVIYFFRWRLRYFYYKAKIKIPQRKLAHGYEEILDYDAFISYAAEDHEIVRQ